MNIMKRSILFISILVLSTLACGLENIQIVESPDLQATITAQALILQQGGQPPVENPVQEQVVVVVTATPEAGAISTEQVQPAQVLPPATGDVTVTVSTATNCRSGPGQNFKIVYGMPVGQVAKVVAKNSYSGYWIIDVPGQAGQTCWLWGQYAVINGDTSTLKEVVTPTSPAPTKTNTPTPTNTVQPTATNTTAAAVAPNAPQITTSNVTCSDAGGGNRNYAVAVSWVDNSNNETGFWVLASPSGSYYGTSANATSTTFTEVLPAGTTLLINLTAQNGSGSSAASSAAFICP